MGKLRTRFVHWVNSQGGEAGDWMVAGALIGAMVAGVLALVVSVMLESVPLLILGFVVFVAHLIYVLAVL